MATLLQQDMWIFLLSFLLTSFSAADVFVTQNESKSWTEANASCDLATPAIDFGENTVDIGQTPVKDGVEYWVGYTYTRQLLLYIGCITDADANKTSLADMITSINPKSVGRCYSACKTDIIGLKMDDCYCFESIPSAEKRHLGCTEICDYEIRCGGVNHVSLFQVLDMDVEEINGSSQLACVAFQQNTDKLVFKGCEEKLPANCQATHFRSKSAKISDNLLSWGNAIDFCLSSNLYPLQGPNNTGHNTTVWTGIFSSQTVISDNADAATITQYGYIKKYENTTILAFKLAGLNQTFEALCAGSDATPSTAIPLLETSVRVEEISSLLPKGGDQPDDEDQDKGIPIINILLYTCVPVVVLVAIATTACIICKRRSCHKAAEQNPTLRSEYSQVPDAYDDTRYAYSAPFDDITNTPEVPADMIDDDDAYDVANTSNAARKTRSRGAESDNVYDKLKLTPDELYNRADTGNVNNLAKSGQTIISPEDATYSSADNGENAYDTTADNGGATTNVTENVYNHYNNDNTYSQTNLAAKCPQNVADNV